MFIIIIIIIIKGNVPNVMPIFVTEVLSATGKQSYEHNIIMVKEL
jgi:hypothetical protein